MCIGMRTTDYGEIAFGEGHGRAEHDLGCVYRNVGEIKRRKGHVRKDVGPDFWKFSETFLILRRCGWM